MTQKNQQEHSVEKSEKMKLSRVPQHVAIIMDGNGRWAAQHHKKRIAGHRAGVDALVNVVKLSGELGIKAVSVFAFSRENWNRPRDEVQQLMRLFLRALKKELQQLKKYNVSVRIVGDRTRLSTALQKQITRTEEISKKYPGLKLVIAVDYGGQWDIVEAAKQMAKDVISGKIELTQIDEALFGSYVQLADLPLPDLLIRTSGELRISNFFLWQIAYTELYFTNIFWPDFDENAYLEALKAFAGRERRFGFIHEQRDS